VSSRVPPGPAQVAAKAAELRRLELLVTRKLDGLLSGEFLGRVAGPGTEPAAARPYVAGDDARKIDWSLTSRSLELQVRSTDADRELETWIVVDRSASLDFGTTEREKSEVAFATAAAFAFLAARHGNRVGVVVAGGERIERLGTASTRVTLLALLSRLYDVPRREGTPAPAASLERGLDDMIRARTRRGQVVVVSDFLDGGEWDRALRCLATRHDLVACQIRDPRELSLPPVGLVSMVDTETGRAVHVQTNSPRLRERYARAAQERQDRIASMIRSAGAQHLILSTDRDWLFDIVRFVVGRRRTRRAAAGRLS
jgi:uncharacterized protein (DUF58 family)